jgi:xylulokinase
MEELIALDVGTTGVKAALIDRDGRVLAEENHSYPMSVLADRVEQDPEAWWEGSVAVMASLVKRTDPRRVIAVGLTGQMQDLITVGSGRVGRAILYSDSRAREQAERVSRLIGTDELCRRTGNIQDATSLLAKILWLRENEPRSFAGIRRFLFGAHDYIAWKLTGSEASDPTTLSTTGLLDIATGDYAYDVIDALDIPRSLLPAVVRADTVDGGLRSEPALLIGLPEGTPVFHGAGDAGSTTIGAGAGVPGALSCYLGTSGWLAATTAGECVDPRTGIFNLRHPDAASLIHVGPMLLAAGNVDWAIEAFGGAPGAADRYDAFTREAASAPAAGGLLYLPYLVGERSPFRDSNARGAFVGLSRSTTRPQTNRAVLEGVAFAMKSIHDAMRHSSASVPRTISLSGGGARSPLWPQIFADAFDCEVTVADRAGQPGLTGVAVIVARALGWQEGYLPPITRRKDRVFRPDPRNRGAYESAYGVFCGLYPALRQSYAALATRDTEGRSGTDPHDNGSTTRRDS